ncbi:MAG: hypothetical protein ACR2HH_08170 [Chthoniobacterales bacterium]
MKTIPVGFYTLCSVGAAFFAGTATDAYAAGITLQKVPALAVEQAPSYPENLARYSMGADVKAMPKSEPIANLQLNANSEDRNGAEAALLCDDPTVGYSLPSGTTTVLVSLPKIENIDSVAFLNKGAKGTMTISTASAKLPANSPQWHKAQEQELGADVVQSRVGPGEAKYIRLTFNLAEPGRIAGFGVYASPQVSDFTAPRERKLAVHEKSDSFALISYNFTDIHAKARALYVSSGAEVKQANNMIDDQLATRYAFAPEDAVPTAVIDLGKNCSLRRVSAVYAPRAGHMDFYVLQSLPAQGVANAPADNKVPAPTPENAPASLEMSDETFANMKAVGSAEDDGSRGRASVDFPETSGRYVMVRFTSAAPANAAFTVAEVAAFGRESQNTLLAANTQAPTRELENTETGTQTTDGKTMLDGKTLIDTKASPGEGPQPESPAEGPPPSLPQPPTFTFVPVMVPTSP